MRTSKLSTRNRQAVSKRLKPLNTKNKLYPTEDEEAYVFHNFLEMKNIPHTHIANEGGYGNKQAMVRGVKAKRMGQSKGVWDYEIFIPIKGITGTVDSYQEIRIELKRQKGGQVSSEQREWGKIYEKAGIPCRICKGAGEAIAFVKEIKKGIR